MVTEPDDKWSYGLSADPEPDGPWPPPTGQTDGADTVRLSTGRWTSPSLGAYDPAGADVVGAADLSDTLGDSGHVGDNGYIEDFGFVGDSGYVEDFGDGRFDDEYDDDEYDDEYDEYDDDVDLLDHDEDEPQESGSARRNAIEWAVVLVGAVLLALILRAVLLQAFWIPSPSMESTLLVRDRVLVNKVSYRLHDINRGDVIVFRRTDDEIARNPELPRDVIKRVIALEGETITIADNKVFIDDRELSEPYLDEGVVTSDFGPEVVPDGHVFVMGDNRELSLDSRFETGPISQDRVVGRAFFLFWPLNRLGSL
ncbi:MAG: signal peptidase I [Acidimicrobiales bacterium]